MPPNFKGIGKTVLTTVSGEAVIAKNWLHAFGMRYPLTLAVMALILGNVIGMVLHV